MNVKECLNAISESLARVNTYYADFYSIVWRGSFEILPHDGHTKLFPNEFALLTRKDLEEGLTLGQWENIKRRIVSYRKVHKLCQAHPKP